MAGPTLQKEFDATQKVHNFLHFSGTDNTTGVIINLIKGHELLVASGLDRQERLFVLLGKCVRPTSTGPYQDPSRSSFLSEFRFSRFSLGPFATLLGKLSKRTTQVQAGNANARVWPMLTVLPEEVH
jgi:hypothetical protein